MKKVLTALLITFAATAAWAQDNTLKEYVGSYKFPDGSYVTQADITLSGDTLSINSVQGSSLLEKKAKDTFLLTSYNGMAYFFRNTEGKIARIKVEVQDILLEGTKEGVSAALVPKTYFINRKQPLAK